MLDGTTPDYYRGTVVCPECGKPIEVDLISLALATQMGGVELLACKYLLRWQDKDGIEDLHKARECVDRLIEHAERIEYGRNHL